MRYTEPYVKQPWRAVVGLAGLLGLVGGAAVSMDNEILDLTIGVGSFTGAFWLVQQEKESIGLEFPNEIFVRFPEADMFRIARVT